jgi:hypothetical protein
LNAYQALGDLAEFELLMQQVCFHLVAAARAATRLRLRPVREERGVRTVVPGTLNSGTSITGLGQKLGRIPS